MKLKTAMFLPMRVALSLSRGGFEERERHSDFQRYLNGESRGSKKIIGRG